MLACAHLGSVLWFGFLGFCFRVGLWGLSLCSVSQACLESPFAFLSVMNAPCPQPDSEFFIFSGLNQFRILPCLGVLSTTALYYNTFISSFNYQSWIVPSFVAWLRTRVDDTLSCKHSRLTSVGAKANPQSTLFAVGSLGLLQLLCRAGLPRNRSCHQRVLLRSLQHRSAKPPPHQGRLEPFESSQPWKAGPAWGGPYVLGGAYGWLLAGRNPGLKLGLSGLGGGGGGAARIRARRKSQWAGLELLSHSVPVTSRARSDSRERAMGENAPQGPLDPSGKGEAQREPSCTHSLTRTGGADAHCPPHWVSRLSQQCWDAVSQSVGSNGVSGHR